jgi:hypothetical protein
LIRTVPVGDGSPLAGDIVVTDTDRPLYAVVIVTYGPVNELGAGVFMMTVAVGVGSPLVGANVVTDIDEPL